MVAQTLVGHFDLRGVFSPDPGPEHSPVFPITLPLAGAAFVAMLQLTFVCEGWPFRRLGPFAGGLAALASSWAIAVLLFVVLVDVRPPPSSGLAAQSGLLGPAQLGALLVLIGLWQAWFFVAWRGWPFSALSRKAARVAAGNAGSSARRSEATRSPLLLVSRLSRRSRSPGRSSPPPSSSRCCSTAGFPGTVRPLANGSCCSA